MGLTKGSIWQPFLVARYCLCFPRDVNVAPWPPLALPPYGLDWFAFHIIIACYNYIFFGNFRLFGRLYTCVSAELLKLEITTSKKLQLSKHRSFSRFLRTHTWGSLTNLARIFVWVTMKNFLDFFFGLKACLLIWFLDHQIQNFK